MSTNVRVPELGSTNSGLIIDASNTNRAASAPMAVATPQVTAQAAPSPVPAPVAAEITALAQTILAASQAAPAAPAVPVAPAPAAPVAVAQIAPPAPVVPAAPTGRHIAVLGSFRSADNAQNHWSTLVSQNANALGGFTPTFREAGGLTMVTIGPMSRDAASQICVDVKTDCFTATQ
jgi:hypothetical protein